MDGDVVVVTIDAIGPKGDQNVGSEVADDAHQLAHRLPLVHDGELPVHVVQEEGGMDAVDLAGAAQFLFPHVGQVGGAGQAGPDDLPCLAARGCHQVDVATLGGVAGQRAPGAEGLVVGVGKDGHQRVCAQFHHQFA